MSQVQTTVSPIDGSVYVERAYAQEADIEARVTAATKAQKAWAKTSLEQRKQICAAGVEAFEARSEKIAEELCWQMGRPIRYAASEVASFGFRARHMLAMADEALAEIRPLAIAGFERYIRHQPVGIVLVVAPWNYPLHTPINAIMPALLAGNSVLLKHSSQTPLCAERMVEAFTQAGMPKGVFQYLHMTHQATEALIASPNIDAVAFTGSVAAGAKIEQAAVGRFIHVGLELGGKDPSYVRADADVADAVANTADGAFFNSGQSCCGIERIYVHAAIYDEFLGQFVELVKQYKLGRSDDPETTLGPMVRPSAVAFVRGQIEAAVAQGAVAHINASDFELDQVGSGSNLAGSAYMAPQVLTQVDHTMAVMVEESFGPVVGIMKVASDAQAVALMNDSDLGLTASIFSRDISAAIALGESLETGTVFVNRCDYLDPELAWCGVKNTGRGCTLSKLGFAAYTRPQSFHVKTS